MATLRRDRASASVHAMLRCPGRPAVGLPARECTTFDEQQAAQTPLLWAANADWLAPGRATMVVT